MVRSSSRGADRGPIARAWVAAIAACVALGAVTAAGCKRSADLNASRELPKLAPPPDAEPPPSTSIAVDVDGRPAPPIDRARLESTKPDFTDDERRAWRLETLVGSVGQRAGAVFTVTGEKGVAVVMRRPAAAGDPTPVLVQNRRGELLAAMVEPSDPFPPYHGRGGSRERRGDPLPRIAGVTKIAVGVDARDASP